MRIRGISLLLLALFLAACGPEVEQEPPLPANPLAGTLWRLTSLQEGDEIRPLPAGTLITAEFGDAEMSGSSGCNAYRTGYELDGPDFSTAVVAQTVELCQDEALMAREQAFVDGLRLAEGYTLDGDKLAISYPGGELQFQRMPPLTGAPFVGTTWRLTAFVEEGQQRPPVEGARISAYFNGQRYSGSTSCNRYNGDYTVEGNIVRPGPAFVTEKDCPGLGIMEQERQFLTILRQNPTFAAAVSEEELLLVHDDGALLFAAGWTGGG